MKAKEVEFNIHGRKIAGKRWGVEGGKRVIALHGWLDNANSFDFIAPELPGLDLLALDFAGHGFSDHRPRHTPYIGMLNVQEVIGVADQLGWENFNLIGHSMGAEVSTHVIGLYPERIERFLAIDGFAASTSAAKALEDIRKSIDDNLHRVSGTMRRFDSREEMAARVAESTGQTLESALALVARGAQEVPGGFSWRSDHRVRWSDALSPTNDLLDHMVASFKGQILVVGARDGSDWYKPTIERLNRDCEHLTYTILDGSHHLHMDADTKPLLEVIRNFFQLIDMQQRVG